jgi:hypothetical protein
MRGDRPFHLGTYVTFLWFTPHARGSTWRGKIPLPLFRVYPACAGIDHHFPWADICRTGLPRMRGDRP